MAIRPPTLLQVPGTGQVVRMCVGLENPLNLQAVILDVCEQLVSLNCAGSAGLKVEVQHGVDDGRAPGGVVHDDVGHRPGLFVEEGSDGGPGKHLSTFTIYYIDR